MRSDFAALILTHGRADNVQTLRGLKDCGYTGRWYLVVDDQDDQLPEYERRYPGKVKVFSKAAVAEQMDLADNGGSDACVVFARNATDAIASELGLKYYIQLDDDYKGFGHRWTDKIKLRLTVTTHLDSIMDAMINFLEESDADTVCYAQAGDYLGGFRRKFFRECLSRKAMNTFILRTGRPIEFPGRINEDVNAYVLNGGRGALYLTVSDVAMLQTETQASKGGMTAAYEQDGTYRKSFYTVMMRPDCARVAMMKTAHARPHHSIKWNNAVPKIISDRYRKA